AARRLPKARTLLLLVTAAALASGLILANDTGAQADTPKTVVLGFDGADADLAARWMDEGLLPNLAKLRDEGTFRPLMPTIPSQTPVSWSTFATGLDPGSHGVFDFLKRDPKNYRPALALLDESTQTVLWGDKNPAVLGALVAGVLALLVWLLLRFVSKKPIMLIIALVLGVGAGVATGKMVGDWVPDEMPVPVNPRQGDTFWQMLGEQGFRTRVVRLPQNFPAQPFENGRLLTGLGTPDLSLRVGKPFFYTSELFFEAEDGGFSLEVVELIDNRGTIKTKIKGPPDRLFSEPGKLRYVEIPMTLTVAEDRQSVRIEVSGNDLTLTPGEWSDWNSFEFPFNPLVSLTGRGRFHLVDIDPEVKLYLSPIQFDPTELPPNVKLSYPADFGEELMDPHGFYKTIGWAIDTWSMNEGTIDEGLFLEDVEMTVARYEQMLEQQLDEASEWDLLMHYFEFTDKVQHMMFRLFDEEHPRYDAALAERYGDSILESYQRMDKIVGRVMERMPKGTRLFIVSDHGFSSWRWNMNYNTWLVKNGYMRLNGEDPQRLNLEMLFDQGDFFVNVDWTQTKAYALGFGNIFINLEGREAQGIVSPEDYRPLMDEIRSGLLSFMDENTGLNPVSEVFYRDEVYSRFDPEIVPDMIAANADYYRAGWQDTLGGISSRIVEPNTKRWSGDHCSLNPALVEGIFFSNGKIVDRPPQMADITPTILDIYDVEASVDLDGESLLPSQP
ncbi:MAG: alkaline phosphatase family protein, partial [Acidobacteriota bacterium]